MRKQSFVLVFGAFIVAFVAVGLLGVESVSIANDLTDHLLEQMALTLHALSHLNSTSLRLVSTATQFSTSDAEV
ncbi:MAG TPA: hypothetical protein VE553_05545 [Candidatus Binatia bacterium]|jgi:hypothetical protein|nr:hypothetical protein [Candidatus Binatia bacterium]